MDSREQFEKWARTSGLCLHFAWEQDRGYLDHDTWKALKTWQASRDAALLDAANFLREHAQEIHDGDMSAIDATHAILALKGKG